MKTDLDLAIAIVKDAMLDVHADVRVHGTDETYETCIRVLSNVCRELVRLRVTLYEVEA